MFFLHIQLCFVIVLLFCISKILCFYNVFILLLLAHICASDAFVELVILAYLFISCRFLVSAARVKKWKRISLQLGFSPFSILWC